jgi:Uncharacterised nucleotidyltransferase
MEPPVIPLSLDNPYALLGLFLAPAKGSETLELLADAARQDRIAWGDLLRQANLHFCTPLWYVRMRQEGLLPLLPPELQEYLRLLHAANLERNQAFREALKEQLLMLHQLEVPAVLLKGAATFCDNLYGDPGARMMGDIDLLVAPSQLESVRQGLTALGYRDFTDPALESPVYAPAYRLQHLSRLHKPGTPVAVEVHFKVGRGQDGRVLPVEMAWEYSRPTSLDGIDSAVLDPTRRLLHNTVHALVPSESFIHSHIPLRDLAEFVALVQRYGPAIAWDEWFEKGVANGLATEFRTYLAVACRLTGMPHPPQAPDLRPAGRHLSRILAAAKHLSPQENRPQTSGLRLQRWATGVRTKSFLHLRLPRWLWCNQCHGQGFRAVPGRLHCMAGRYRWMWHKKWREKPDGIVR